MMDFFDDFVGILVLVLGIIIAMGIIAGVVIVAFMNIANLWWAIPVGILLFSLDITTVSYFAG